MLLSISAVQTMNLSQPKQLNMDKGRSDDGILHGTCAAGNQLLTMRTRIDFTATQMIASDECTVSTIAATQKSIHKMIDTNA